MKVTLDGNGPHRGELVFVLLPGGRWSCVTSARLAQASAFTTAARRPFMEAPCSPGPALPPAPCEEEETSECTPAGLLVKPTPRICFFFPLRQDQKMVGFPHSLQMSLIYM